MDTGRNAVVLLSGGLDSTTTLAIALEQGFAVHALSFDYGQRAAIEVEAARRVTRRLGVTDHVVVRIDLGVFGGSALTGDLPMAQGRRPEEIGQSIPTSYVPARNTIFLSFALAWAEVLGAGDIFIGAHVLDFGGYPDCRPEYFAAYERMANLATKAGVEGRASFAIHTPLIDLTKAQIIRRGLALGVDYSLTVSCYAPSSAGEACGACDACVLRRAGFLEAGLEDPTPYRAGAPDRR